MPNKKTRKPKTNKPKLSIKEKRAAKKARQARKSSPVFPVLPKPEG
jgi:hypothetical protein